MGFRGLNKMNGRCPGQAHGKEFYAIGNIVSSSSNGRFTIQRLATAEEMKEWELSPEMQAKKDKRIANKKSKVKPVSIISSTIRTFWLSNFGKLRLKDFTSPDDCSEFP